jgi:hypothetical protein
VPEPTRGKATRPVKAGRASKKPDAHGAKDRRAAASGVPKRASTRDGGIAASAGIGELSERGVHRYLKERYSSGESYAREAAVDGKIADIARYGRSGKALEVIEIQTRALHKLIPKVRALASSRKVRVVYPVAVELSIVTLGESGEIVSGPRKSPKKGDVWSLFDELVRATGLLEIPKASIEVAFIRAEEVRVRDGSGSWRRKGVRIAGREVTAFIGSRRFSRPADWAALIPESLGERFVSAEFAAAAGIGPARARRALYCLAVAGAVARAGKRGRSLEWSRLSPIRR